MRTYDECVGAIIAQAKHDREKLGKIDLYDMDNVADAAEMALTEQEYDEYCGGGHAIRDALWSL